MAKVKISEFDTNPDNNTDIDNINIAENCPPANINNAIRELMAQLKDFQEDEWYEKHTWTTEQENEYIVWMSEELFNNEAMREELLENPEKSIMNCFHAAVHFVANFGWDTLGDIVDNIEENKVK